jgi:hypothetical protein
MRMPASPTRPVWETGLPWERRRAPPRNHNIVRFALPREARRSNEFNASRNCWVRRASLFFQGVSEWLPKLERGEASIHSGRRPCRWKPIVMRPNLIGASHWSDVRDRPRAPNCVPPAQSAFRRAGKCLSVHPGLASRVTPAQLQNAVSLESLLGGIAITLWLLNDRRGLADRRRIAIHLAAACVHVRYGPWRREGRQDRSPRARQILVGRAGGRAPTIARSTVQRAPHL